MMTTAQRSETARALAKAIAYHDCGKQEKANLWAIRLVRLLRADDILTDVPAEYLDLFGEG